MFCLFLQSQGTLKALLEEQAAGSLRGLADLDARVMALQAKVGSNEQEFNTRLAEVSRPSSLGPLMRTSWSRCKIDGIAS